MSIYLKAKHWQLFILFMGTMIGSQAVLVSSGMGFSAVILPTLIMGVLFFGWLWAIAEACYKQLPEELASSPKPMQVGLIYAILYLALGGYFFFGPDEKMPGYGIVLHLLGMVAIFYSFGFTAKQLTKLDQNKKVTFFNYSGPLFLFWFFPIGVWFIQPKVNSLLGGKNA